MAGKKNIPTGVGYVDGYVIPLRKGNVEQYRKSAEIACKVWLEYGALSYTETVGDDLEPGFGRPFPALTGIEDTDTVIFAFVGYRDRAHRDEVNAKVLEDDRIKEMCPENNPGFQPGFDPKLMSFGGFTVLVNGEKS